MKCDACKRAVDKLVEVIDIQPSGVMVKFIRCENCMEIAMEIWKGRPTAWLN